MNKTLLILGTLLFMSSCAKEEFAVRKGSQSSSVSQALSYQNKICSQRTLVKPPVDILILWDNTASTNFISPSTLSAMGNLITSISDKFDYHVLNMPLVATTSTRSYINEGVLVARNPNDISNVGSDILMRDDGNSSAIQKAKAALSFNQSHNGTEQAASRAFNIIKGNLDNNTGVFRRNAYTITVVISNEDDKGACGAYDDNCYKPTYVTDEVNKLLCLRGHTSVLTDSQCNSIKGSTSPLSPAMFRFLNISPRSQCQMSGYRTSTVYPEYSRRIYMAGYNNGTPSPNDQWDRAPHFDSHDICTTSFSNIFQSIESIITEVEIKHKYDHWPVAGGNQVIDLNSIRVIRSDGKELVRTNNVNDSEGFVLVSNGNTVTRNTRYEPTAGEPFTGKLIQLLGSDRISYPDCLTVYYEDQKQVYGYIYLTNGKPNEATISVKVSRNNGASYETIPKSTSNGWQYVGFVNNISGLSSTERVDQVPPNVNSGYVIKLNGSYKQDNSTNIRFVVDYISSSN